MPSRCDVCIVGAGPAGAAFAVLAASQGRDVILGEFDLSTIDRPGEHLAGDVVPVLERLGVSVPLHPAPGTVSTWVPGPARVISAMTNPFGYEHGVRRGALDAALRDRAEAVGATLARAHRFCGASRRSTGWAVRFRHDSGEVVVHADFIVDASGRRAAVAQHFGASITRVDSLTAFVAWLGPDAALASRFHMLHVEAVRGGWWAAVTLPREVVSLTLVAPRVALRRHGLRAREFWRQMLDLSRSVAPLLPREAWSPARLKSFPAAPALTNPLFGEDWLAIGDAAAQFDPIEGRGVQRALELAARGAELLQLERSGRARLLPVYADAVAEWHHEHRRERMAVYHDARERLGPEFLGDLDPNMGPGADHVSTQPFLGSST